MAYSKDIHRTPLNYIDFYEGMIKMALRDGPTGVFWIPSKTKGLAHNMAMRNNTLRSAILSDLKDWLATPKRGYYDPSHPQHTDTPPYHVKLAMRNAAGFTFKVAERDGVWGVLCQNQFAKMEEELKDVGFDMAEFFEEAAKLDENGERTDAQRTPTSGLPPAYKPNGTPIMATGSDADSGLARKAAKNPYLTDE